MAAVVLLSAFIKALTKLMVASYTSPVLALIVACRKFVIASITLLLLLMFAWMPPAPVFTLTLTLSPCTVKWPTTSISPSPSQPPGGKFAPGRYNTSSPSSKLPSQRLGGIPSHLGLLKHILHSSPNNLDD